MHFAVPSDGLRKCAKLERGSPNGDYVRARIETGEEPQKADPMVLRAISLV